MAIVLPYSQITVKNWFRRMNDLQEISTHLIVVAVALVGSDGKVLMQRRRFGSVHGGLWEFPGGKVEAGESPESAVVREIAEELGIALAISALAPVGFASGPGEAAAGRGPLVILLYICRDWSGAPQCLEGEEIAWIEPRAVPELAMPPLDYPLARALIASLASDGENKPS